MIDDGGGSANGTGRHGGHGLVGMRERVALFDGSLETGARPEGGYRVSRAPAAVSIRVAGRRRPGVVRAGLRMILEAQDDIEVVGEAGDGAEAIEAVAGEARTSS